MLPFLGIGTINCRRNLREYLFRGIDDQVTALGLTTFGILVFTHRLDEFQSSLSIFKDQFVMQVLYQKSLGDATTFSEVLSP